MNNFFQKRKDKWKEIFLKEIEKCKQIDSAIGRILQEYIFYSVNLRNLKYRIRKSVGAIENEVKHVRFSRKDIKDKKKLSEIAKELEALRKKLRSM